MVIAEKNGMDWQRELKNNISTVEELEEFIDLNEEEKDVLKKVANQHPMNIPRYYLGLINRDDPADPIRKLAVPTSDELVLAGSMGATTPDPYGDDKHDKGNGVLHK